MEQISKEQEVERIPVSFEEFEAQYHAATPEDRSKIVGAVREAHRQYEMRGRDTGSTPVEGVYGALVTVGEDGLEFHIPIIPGIFSVRVSTHDLERLWDWLRNESHE